MNYMFLPFRRYFDFQGRSRRLEFWLFFLLNAIIGTIFTIIAAAMVGAKLVNLMQRYGVRTSSYGSGSDFDFGYGWSLNIPPDVLIRELGTPFIVLASVYALYACIIFFPNLAVTIRRLHDSNRTGWWIVLPSLIYLLSVVLVLVGLATPSLLLVFGVLAGILGFIAVICALVLLVFLFLDGTPGYNQYGPDPKQRDYRPTFA